MDKTAAYAAKKAAGPSNIADIRFSTLVGRMEQCATRAKDLKPADRPTFFLDLKLRELYLQGQSIFPYLRLLLPAQDLERRNYGMQEKTIGNLYIEALGLSSANSKAKSVINYRDPNKQSAGSTAPAGDFASVLEREILQAYCPTEYSNWTITDVNKFLDELSSNAEENKDKKKELIKKAVFNLNAKENKWLVRIILKDLKIGMRHEKVLGFLHPDAPEVYNNNPNLRELVDSDEIRNPKKRIFSSISLGKPFYPMLCKRQDLDPATKNSQLFRDKNGILQKFRVEDKLDGERVIAHKQNTSVTMFSRNCNSLIDYANVFQTVFQENILAEDAILDGEMMAWDSDLGCFLPFGQNRTVVHEQQEMGTDSHRWMVFKVFDVLWADGIKVENTNSDTETIPHGDITHHPLEVRKHWLNRLVQECPLRLELMGGNLVASEIQSEQEESVVKYFEDSINRQCEGIVVKQCDSNYVPGDRKGSWVKVKPEYMEGASDTLDVVIVGGYYADGARRTGISHFLVAVADPNGGFEVTDSQEAAAASPPRDGRTRFPKQWRVLCKVGSGYNKEELLEIQERLKPFWKKIPKQGDLSNRIVQMPDFLSGWSPRNTEEAPDVVIEPRNSIVLELVGAELVPSTDMNSGYYLRFPRVLRRRDDKLVSEADTVSELRRIWQQKNGKMSKTQEDGAYKMLKRRKASTGAATKRAKNGQEISQRFVVPSGNDAAELNVLEGVTVYSVPLNTKELRSLPEQIQSQKLVDELIGKLGGNVRKTFSPSDTKLAVAESDQNFSLKNLLKYMEKNNMDIDILKPQWLLDCYKAGKRVPVEPSHAIQASKATSDAMKLISDKYGDHYTRDSTVDELKETLDHMPSDVAFCQISNCTELKEAFSNEPYLQMAFSSVNAYFYDLPDVKIREYDPCLNSIILANLLYRLQGGKVATTLSKDVTHVFIDRTVTDPDALTDWNLPEDCMIMRTEWIHKCYQEGRLVNQQDYTLAEAS